MKTPYVKKYISDALFLLMRNKRFEDITVTDIIKKAGVCRASFYRNYLDKNQIIDEFLETMLIDIANDDGYEDIKQGIQASFAGIYKYREPLSLLAKNDMLDGLYPALYSSTLEHIKKLNVYNTYYQPIFFAGASSAVIQEWIKTGFNDSVAEMTEIFIGSLKGYMEL